MVESRAPVVGASAFVVSGVGSIMTGIVVREHFSSYLSVLGGVGGILVEDPDAVLMSPAAYRADAEADGLRIE